MLMRTPPPPWRPVRDVSDRTAWAPQQWDVWDLPATGYLTGPQSGEGRTVIFDLEGDGLLEAVPSRGIKQITQLWCIGALDIHTREKFYWGVDQGEGSLEEGIKFLSQVSRCFAHNGIGFDYEAMERLYPDIYTRPREAWDTMILAKMVWPVDLLAGPDFSRAKAGKMPANLVKRHSLEAWGYRLGTFKTDYKGGFDQWCPAMATYLMGGDLDVPMALWELIERRIGWGDNPEKGVPAWDVELTVQMEHEAARIIHEQQQDGVRFDREAATKLASRLMNEQAELGAKLKDIFGSWWQPLHDPEKGHTPKANRSVVLTGEPDITVRRFSDKRKNKDGSPVELKPYVGPPKCEYSDNAPYVDVVYTTFNPGSRDHLGQRLQAVYGWKPKLYGKNGKPTVDESVLAEIPEAVMPAEVRKTILDYFVVSKTLGMLAEGRKAWLRVVSDDGRMRGRMDTLGTITRRGSHFDPNLGQVNAVIKAKVKQPDGTTIEVPLEGLEGRYGLECRALYCADSAEEHGGEEWEQTGVDASSLELILLGHYLHPHDGGAFSARVCDPKRDAHSEHAELCGITRGDAKTTIYLFIYGGSAWKLSLDRGIVVSADQVLDLLGYRGLPMLLRSLERRFDAEFVAKLDDMQKARLSHCRQLIIKLGDGIPGLKILKDGDEEGGIPSVTQVAQRRGWIKAIDGSKLPVRKAHAALNALLQSAGAIACKLWMVLVHRKLRELGYRRGVDFKQILWVHDELQFTHRPGLGPIIKQVAEECMVRTGELLGLRGRFRTDGKTGRNWRDCH